MSPVLPEKAPGRKILKKEMSTMCELFFQKIKLDPSNTLRTFTEMDPSVQNIHSNAVNYYLQTVNSHLKWGEFYGGRELIPLVYNRFHLRGSELLKGLLGNPRITHFAKTKIIANQVEVSEMSLSMFFSENPELFEELSDMLAGRLPEIFINKFIQKKDMARIGLISKTSPEKLWNYHVVGDLILTRDKDFIFEVFSMDFNKSSVYLGALLNFTNDIPDEIKVGVISRRGNALRLFKKYGVSVTTDMQMIAVKQSGISLQYVEVKDRTQELCDAAVTRAVSALKYVPKEKQKKHLILKKTLEGKSALKYVK